MVMEPRELSISGMSCGHCIAAVRGALEQLPGVQVLDVKVGKARLEVEPGAVTDATLIDAVEDAGYSAMVSR